LGGGGGGERMVFWPRINNRNHCLNNRANT